MAMNKISINIRLELLDECNRKDLKRLFDKPIGLKPMAYVYTANKTVEVTDPSVTAKGFSRVLLQSMRRNMQIFAVRAKDGLKAIDKEEKDPKKQKALVEKLKQTMLRTRKEMSAKADSNLKQIIEEATKDAPKWDKARDARNGMSDVDNGNKDFKKTVEKLVEALVSVSNNIETAKEKEGPDRVEKIQKKMEKERVKFEIKKEDDLEDINEEFGIVSNKAAETNKKIEKIRREGVSDESTTEDLKKLVKELADTKKEKTKLEKKLARKERDLASDEQEMMEEYDKKLDDVQKEFDKEMKGYAKDALGAFTTYRQDRKGFNDTLKKTLNMSKMIDSKAKESEVIGKLHDMLKKKVRPAAEGYRKYLDDCDKDIMLVVKNLGSRTVTEDQIKKAMPDVKSGKAAVLFKAFKDVQDLMKREKIK